MIMTGRLTLGSYPNGAVAEWIFSTSNIVLEPSLGMVNILNHLLSKE